MKIFEPKYANYIKAFSLITQVSILILAVVLIASITTKQYNSSQIDSMKSELLDQMHEDRKAFNERLKLLKEELVTYQSTREGRAQLFADKIEENRNERLVAVERLNKRIDNLNSKVNYWTGKVKQKELEDKLKKQ